MRVLFTTVAGLGLGPIPTINTLVAQYTVPKRLLGVAVGAIAMLAFFLIIITIPEVSMDVEVRDRQPAT